MRALVNGVEPVVPVVLLDVEVACVARAAVDLDRKVSPWTPVRDGDLDTAAGPAGSPLIDDGRGLP
jgi:hypothetical protein